MTPYRWKWMENTVLRRLFTIVMALPVIVWVVAKYALDGVVNDGWPALAEGWRGLR